MIPTNVRPLRGPANEADARFSAFYRVERPAAVRLAALLTQRVAAEDVVQDAFVGLYPRFDRLDNPAAYLRVAILNGCRQMHRRRAVELDRMPRLVAPGFDHPELPALADAVALLPYRQRAVLVLRYWLDLSEDDIAEALGCRPGTVKSLSSRALERLGKEVER